MPMCTAYLCTLCAAYGCELHARMCAYATVCISAYRVCACAACVLAFVHLLARVNAYVPRVRRA